jgi:hypothetical protein
MSGDVVRKIVVVFDGLEGQGVPKEAEVVDGDGTREESLYCWRRKFSGLCKAREVEMELT